MFVSGFCGTGKSFIIENVVKWNKTIRGKDTVVTAPTGIAALNVKGLTIHRILQLPVKDNGTAEYKALTSEAIEVIRKQFRKC